MDGSVDCDDDDDGSDGGDGDDGGDSGDGGYGEGIHSHAYLVKANLGNA